MKQEVGIGKFWYGLFIYLFIWYGFFSALEAIAY